MYFNNIKVRSIFADQRDNQYYLSGFVLPNGFEGEIIVSNFANAGVSQYGGESEVMISTFGGAGHALKTEWGHGPKIIMLDWLRNIPEK